MVAIKIGRETMVGLILQYATNLNVTSFKNESALMLANQSTNFKIKSMVMERYEYLKEMNLDNVLNYNQTTPVKNEFLLHYCSPTPLSIRKLKSQIKVGKSLTYSPNKTPQTSCQSPVSTGGNSIWKIALPKIFCSPQLKAHNDVQQFLKTLGLEKYWPIFRDEEVDFETLLTLNEENLKELGIT